MKVIKKHFLLLLLAFLCIPFLFQAASASADSDDADAGTAELISKSCKFTRDGTNSITFRINDNKLDTAMILQADEHLTIRSKNGQLLGWLNFRYGGIPGEAFSVSQFDESGSLISETSIQAVRLIELFKLDENCRSVMITSPEKISFIEIEVYSQGVLPDSVVTFSPEVEKCDFLIITTHPDDEWLFLGGIYPIWGAEKGYTGTYAYITTPNYGRLQEALNGLYTGGLRTYPFFLGFPDVDRSAPAEEKATFSQEEVTLSLVRLYRQIKPLVVITQDPVTGEYGHWQHIVGAQAAYDAVALAADSSYDPESAGQYGTWQVKKLYQHMGTENQILIDVLTPLDAFDGKTALQVAKLAYKEHKSQLKYSFYPSIKEGSYGDLRKFGLAYTTVGYDTGNDIFENIPITETTKSAALKDLLKELCNNADGRQ